MSFRNILDATDGATKTARVRVIFCGSGRRRRTVTSIVEPGVPCNSRLAYASGMSRVPTPLMVSMMSPVPKPAFAAGELGKTLTTPI